MGILTALISEQKTILSLSFASQECDPDFIDVMIAVAENLKLIRLTVNHIFIFQRTRRLSIDRQKRKRIGNDSQKFYQRNRRRSSTIPTILVHLDLKLLNIGKSVCDEIAKLNLKTLALQMPVNPVYLKSI